MYFNKTLCSAAVFALCSAFNPGVVVAGAMGPVTASFKGHFLAHIGGFSAIQGRTQEIYVQQNLIGNYYSVISRNQGSGLVGLGYFLDGPTFHDRFALSYGVNAFFLGQTSVRGYIVQEDMFTNLSYQYRIRNIPLYFTGKTIVDTPSDSFKLAFDVGIGPNFMQVGHYRERALTEFTIPDNAFSSRTNANFAATVGASVRFHNAPEQLPIECGYRFFYLGQGRFDINNNQAINALSTGQVYANALACTVTI